ncbi:glycoside hydrolase family 65 protein [Longirhabdus pacifica]|uniref:glycoside hydrolase family 65 protein n=1 Tax=Longirhabdus pacifica TaxID=2305227 RepID=UPI0010091035|nr:glycosyl hydrolase family 65 protein [Longirhabdus pacifica]
MVTWTLTEKKLNANQLWKNESLYSLGNGYIGVRGNFEEGYEHDMPSVRGTYMNAFHDVVDIPYGEKLYGFPTTQQTLLPIIDCQTVQIYLGDEMERFSLFTGEIMHYERTLHLDRGCITRKVHWKSPLGKEIIVSFHRLVSMITKECFVIHVELEPVNFLGNVKIFSSASISRQGASTVDTSDPRVSAHVSKLHTEEIVHQDDMHLIIAKTTQSNLKTACAVRHEINTVYYKEITTLEDELISTFQFTLSKPVTVTKKCIYTDTLRHGDTFVDTAIQLQHDIMEFNIEALQQQQHIYFDHFWSMADIKIKGDSKLQQGIRFNIYHLLQSIGRDPYSHIAAKGLSGIGYEGHYFWDTEIYMFPFFLMTHPQMAESIIRYRYHTLEQAKERAKEMGHGQGALYPWRTISGTECSSFFPAGTAQYHISADIAYSVIQYYLASYNQSFMVQYGAEILFETARLWMDVGHYYNGKFRIDGVTGPDEYTCIVNNNYYTNVMAKYNLMWAAKVYDQLLSSHGEALKTLCEKLHVEEKEVQQWRDVADNMYLPYNEQLGINPQDDTFLNKAIWDFESTSKEKYPLLLHYHPLTLYRYQVCKQADTVLAHFLVEDESDTETMKRTFDYYETITTHDSSLSYSIFSIMAAKLREPDKAYDYFMETARLDIDDLHHNTKDGLHLANMGGTWMSIVYGFAGLRLKESGISLAPLLPRKWQGFEFYFQYKDRKIQIEVTKTEMVLTLMEGDALPILVYDEQYVLQCHNPTTINTQT